MSKRAFALGEGRRMRTGFLLGATTLIGVAALSVVLAATSRSSATAETPFFAENKAAMVQMMAGMEALPSGDADRDFAAMMIPHHQGAIAMAEVELRHGRNEQLRRLAQGIIIEQQQEIAVMRVALGDAALRPSGAICTALSASPSRPVLASWATREGAANDKP